MNSPALSVIIPNFNHAQFLPTCLRAVLAQAVPVLEVIVIDDCSTDDSVEVIQRFAAQHPVIRFLRNEQNRGVVWNMNRGLELARGDYVVFPAADDEVLPGFFQKSLGLLARHPQAALSCTIGDWREVGTGLNWHVGVGMAEVPCYLPPDRLVALERAGKLFIASHTAIFRRASLTAAGGFIPELKWHCDWFAMYVTAFRHGICFVPEPLGIANIHATSYYQRGRSRAAEYSALLENMLGRLVSPACAEVVGPIRDSGALFLFGWPILRLMLGRPEFRWLVTPTFLRKNLWHIFKLTAKPLLPTFVAEWYFRLAGYRVRAPKSA